ncbi:MAG: hypothetical protein AAF705_03700 [Bacteroidota bacterium]
MINKNRLKLVKGTLIFGTMLLMMFFFVNDGLDLVDLDHFLPQGLEILLLFIMGIGGVLMIVDLVRQPRKWKRRDQALPRPSLGVLFILALFLILFAVLPIVTTSHLGERIAVYAVILLVVATAILHRYYESG